MAEALWLTEAEVVDLIDLAGAIEAVEAGLRLEAVGEAESMPKTYATWGHGHTLHAIGAAAPGASMAGTKTWVHATGDANPLVLLFESESGALLAVVEAFALGQMRTAAMSAVATKWLAAPEAAEFALIGTGKQAMAQAAAVCAVRPIERLRVYSPDAGRRAAFAERLRGQSGCDVAEAESAAEAAHGAGVVTTVTRAREPFLEGSMLRPGAHINAVGAIVPDRAEIAQDVLPRCSVVATDTVAGVRELSREFVEYYSQGRGDWNSVQRICQVVAAGDGRPEDADLTLFKAMGTGLSDLSVAAEVYRRAVDQGKGRTFTRPGRAAPRLWVVGAATRRT